MHTSSLVHRNILLTTLLTSSPFFLRQLAQPPESGVLQRFDITMTPSPHHHLGYMQLLCRLHDGVDSLMSSRLLCFLGGFIGLLSRSDGGVDSFAPPTFVGPGAMSGHLAVRMMVSIRSMPSLAIGPASGGASSILVRVIYHLHTFFFSATSTFNIATSY